MSVCLCSVISIVEQFQSDLDTVSQTLTENVMEDLKKKKSSYCTKWGHSRDFSELSWVVLEAFPQSRLLCWRKHMRRRGPGKGRGREGGGRGGGRVQILVASFHLLRKWLAWRTPESPGHSVDFWLGPHSCSSLGLAGQQGRWSSSPQGPWASVALVYFRRCYWKHKTKCLEGTIKNRRNMGDLIIQWVFIRF